MINCDVSPRLWPSQRWVQLEGLAATVFYDVQGLRLLSVCSSHMCHLTAVHKPIQTYVIRVSSPSPHLLCISYMFILPISAV